LYSWPAGYLRDVESRDELNDRYLNYSINPAHRAPLFELVFHDCVVNYWYWGACNDYLHDVAPEITDRKTAMNVLYGTPPMMWAYKHGLNWREPEDREKMLMIYRSVCKLHEVVGMQELMSHEFLTPDHMVQRTTFEDGTVCVANFAKAPYKLTDAQGTSFMLRENDFHVLGPKIEQWRVSRVDGEGKVSVKSFVNTGEVVFFDAADDFFTGAPGIGGKGKIWLALETPERAGITLYPGSSLSLDLASWQPAWKGESAVLLVLDSAGRPCARGSTVRDGKLELPVAERAANYVLLVGSEARKADVNLGEIVIEADGLKLETEQVPRPEAQLVAAATLTNNGLVSANDLTVSFRLGGASGRVLGEVSVPTLAPGATRRVEAPPFLAARADGRRRITVVVTSPEPCTQTGRVHLETRFRGPVQVSLFSFRRSLKLRIPQGDSTGVAAELPFSIDASVDPSNLRVLFADGRSAPAQFEPSAESATKGMLVFQLPAGLTAGAASCQVLGGGQGAAAPFPFAGEFEVAQDGSRLRFDSYSASLVNGVLKDIAVREADGGERIVIQQIIESSKETGWSAEPGTVEELVLESVGAVRAVFRMRKRLTADYVLERRFLFYADRFEIHSRCTPARTLLTRVLFAVPGTATKQTGGVVPMDGAGNMEGFGFQKNDAPDWYAVYAPDYRFVCVALSPHAGLTWWDEGTLGQAGIGHPAAVEWEKRLFFVTAEGAEDGT
ncbi:MAG: hypothetical protein KAI66_23635, partial [Lentisphaeria bacterium]|nr:hypothetical protein [Lentisphaeria bacterium]